MPLSPGTRIGQYEIRAPLGAGGMGEVYRAHDARLGRDVALKVLHPNVALDAVRLERFTREARAVAALNHPHIVTIYSTEDADGLRFMTMELVEGRTLDELVPREGLPVPRFLELALPLADALTAAHRKQITHRDLKPGNVMVAADGRVKVLDFGLARVDTGIAEQTMDATRAVLTGEGTIVGTMPYMSPEQVEGRAIDARSDLFSLGVMFYEMLAGSRPFKGPSSAALMTAILRDDPEPLSSLRSDVPDVLVRLIGRCLEKRPEDRVQTARDVFNELRHVQKQIESGATRRAGSGPVSAAPEASLWIAVLPFGARSADADTEALAAGLTEDITSGLSRFPALSVVAPQSAGAFRNSPLDVRQVAERLGARYVLGGTVRRSAASVRIATHLIDARSGAHLWSDTYDKPLAEGDHFSIQDDIADRVVATVADKAGVLARSMVQATRELPLEQLSARELIFRCWKFQWHPTPSAHADLRRALEQHLDARPDNPHLWAELANMYICEHSLFANPLPDPLGRAMRAARRAIEIDPGNQEGWEMVALVSFYQKDEPSMLEAADRAIRLNPRNSNALAWMGNIRTHAGDYDRGCELTARAMTLNPSHPGWYHFAPFSRHFAREEYADALKAARRVNMPEFMWMQFAVAASSGQLGLAREGTVAVESLARLAPALADEANLREFVTRWYWPEELIERLLDGVALARNASAPSKQTSTRVVVSSAATARPPSSGSDGRANLSASASTELRIAVLPFGHRGGDVAESLADGLTDDITTGLSRFPHLRVVPAGTASALTAESAPFAGVRYLLEGRVQGGGDAVRVTVRLIDGVTGSNLWAQTFDRAVGTTAFEVQDDVASHVVATVGDTSGVLARSMAASLLHRPVEELSVRELVLRFHAYVEHFQAEEHARLRGGLERALARDPLVAEGWACLADLYEHEHSQRLNPLPDSLGRQRRAAQQALNIDPHNQRGWTAMAAVHTFERDLAALRMAAERAIGLNPLDADTLGLCALFLSCAGDDDRAMELFARAVRLKPQHPGWYHFPSFTTHFKRREYAEALAEAKRIALPQLPTSHLSAAVAAARIGSASEALTAIDALRRLDAQFLERDAARGAWALWLWDDALISDLVDGLEEALALSGTQTAAEPRPPSGATATGSGGTAHGAPSGLTVAVLPFEGRANDSDAMELARGLTDDVTTGLSRFGYLRVRAGTPDLTGRDARAAGGALNVGYVLDGAVRRSGAAFRVRARLTDVATGEHLWAENYDRDASSALFALQDDLASRIVATLADGGGVLGRVLVEALRGADPQSASGLIAEWAGYVEHFTPDKHAALRDGLEALVPRQPDSATTWAYLSILYGHEIFFDFNPRPDPMPRMRHAAERAVTLDPDNQTAWYAVAEAEFFERHPDAFRSAAERAIEINQLHSRTLGGIGLFYAYTGDTARGAALVARAMSLNPRFPGWFHIATLLDAFQRGDADSALAHAARINMPHLPAGGRLFAIAAAGRFGREREARDGLRLLRDSRPELLNAEAARREWARWIWEGALLDALVGGYAAALQMTSSAPQPPDGPRPASGQSGEMRSQSAAARALVDAGMAVAVLPFTARGGDDAAALADGLTDDVTTALARFPYLQVVARDAVRAIGDAARGGSEVALRLNARFALEGAVRQVGGQVRVSTHLSDTQTGAHLWAETFDRSLDAGLFSVQDNIVGRVAATVADGGGVLVRSLASRIKGRGIETFDTAELVLHYHGDFAERFDPADHAALRDAFEAVVARDPVGAHAWACLAMLYAMELFFGVNPKPDPLARLRHAAERANALDPTIQHGWVAMATAALFGRDRAALEAATDRALALNPLHTRSLATLGLFTVFSGDTERGMELVDRSLALNPRHPGWYLVAPFLRAYERGEFAQALGFAKRIGMPNFVSGHLAAAAAAGQVGTVDDARPALEVMARFDARLIEPDGAREVWSRWIWESATVDRLVEGLEKALELTRPAPRSS